MLSRGFIIATPLDADAPIESNRAAVGGKQQHKSSVLGSPTAFVKKLPSELAKIPSGLGKKVIRRHFELAELLSSVIKVEDVAGGGQ